MKYSWKLDDFDSEVFGFRIAKIQILDSKDVKELIEDFIKNKVEYATYRVKSNNFSTINSLEKSGFILVDCLISLSVDISNAEKGESARKIREANRNDLEKLRNLTYGLYSTSRIFNDNLISKNKANEFYVRWIENSILGRAADSVLIWEEDRKILGYITLQKKGQIPLVGVSKEARGKGIAKKLIKASFNKFKEWKVENIMVETQVGNIPALRVYQNCGFKIIDSFLTLRWARDD